jgi:poly(hydroxyalkanoate) depolymerase family esterase
MRNLSDTIERLTALRRNGGAQGVGDAVDRLTDFKAFGSNPGALRARIYIPKNLSGPAPLVVVLHGCTQTAAGYDHGSGWSALADRLGFALLFPEQQRANNPNLCFNWFAPGDIARDAGEALSIRQMIEAVAAKFDIDRRRVFVTGLSAGGAMAGAMLATYPELFAGGAIIAGLPYGCATTIPEAFDRMRGHAMPAEQTLQALLRNASDHDGPWPTLSIWHGTADRTVNPSNADALIAQWRGVHGLDASPDAIATVDGYPRRVWRNAEGRETIEAFAIAGMDHGAPLAATGKDGVGAAGPFMLEAGISSTEKIAGFWNLSRSPAQPPADRDGPSIERPPALQASREERIPALSSERDPPHGSSHHPAKGVRQIIEDALRAAGLMK